jgi:integrase
MECQKVPNFTDLAVQKLPPGTYFDGRTPAFGIRVGKNRRTWIVTKGKNRTKVTLGHYPALSLADARKKALVVMGSPHAPQTAPPFPEALAGFLAQTHWKASTRYTVEKCIRKHFKFTRTLDRITHEDIAKVIDELPHGAAGEAVKNIRAFFNWCVPRYLPASPCVGLRKPASTSRERILTDEELKKVWKAAEQTGYPFGTIVLLLILTGQRRGEIAALEKQWIKEDTITLPKRITKNGREHTFPIAVSVTSTLGTVPNFESLKHQTLLFPARGKPSSIFNGFSKSKASLDRLCGVKDWTLHDLRRTFATGLASLNVPIHVTEKLLNHVSGTTGGIVAVYQRHSYWTEQVAALKAWEDKVLSLARSG